MSKNRTVVISENITGDHSDAQLCFRLALAYAETSEHNFRSMLGGQLPATFDHAKASHFLFEHALELFFKGAIFSKTGKLATSNHNLQQLYNRYRKLYPQKAFALGGRILDTVRIVDKSPHSVFPRYYHDTDGSKLDGFNCYTLEKCLAEVEHLRADMGRIIPQIEPLPPPTLS